MKKFIDPPNPYRFLLLNGEIFLILLHLKEPAAIVRALCRLVRPGGLMTFQDINITPYPDGAADPACHPVRELDRYRVQGGRHEPRYRRPDRIGAARHRPDGAGRGLRRDAGPAESVMPQYMADTFRSLLPTVLAHCQVTEAEVDIETLTERLAHEFKEFGAILWMPELAAARARVP